MTPDTVDEIFELFKKYGASDYIGEPISQLEHAVQGAQLAEQFTQDEEVILAALFHDIGHLVALDSDSYESMDGYGMVKHELAGAAWLRQRGFSEKVCKLIENHVTAKRYLTFKYPDYLARLSEASLKTLGFQGGPMTAEEAANFEADPLFEASIKMREWDEAAKETGRPIPDLTPYREMAIRHLSHPH